MFSHLGLVELLHARVDLRALLHQGLSVFGV
jgi:hypothetical protein